MDRLNFKIQCMTIPVKYFQGKSSTYKSQRSIDEIKLEKVHMKNYMSIKDMQFLKGIRAFMCMYWTIELRIEWKP